MSLTIKELLDALLDQYPVDDEHYVSLVRYKPRGEANYRYEVNIWHNDADPEDGPCASATGDGPHDALANAIMELANDEHFQDH